MRIFFQWVLILSLPLISQNTFAGGVEGHGGVGLVCRDRLTHEIKEVWLLDQFERWQATRDFTLDFDLPEAKSMDPFLTLIEQRLENFPEFKNAYLIALNKIKKAFVFIPDGTSLPLTEDAFPVVRRRGCGFEQIAIFQKDGSLQVDEKLWRNLGFEGEAALMVHEAIYMVERQWLDAKSSVHTRDWVGTLFSRFVDEARLIKLAQDLKR